MLKLGTVRQRKPGHASLPNPIPRAIVYRHVADPHWFAITATNSGTSTLQWFAETFCRSAPLYPAGQPMPTSRLKSLAADSVPGARGLLFHPYLQGESARHTGIRIFAWRLCRY